MDVCFLFQVLPTHLLCSSYGTDRLLLKKKFFFFLMSVFPTRSQILSSIFTVFSCSKYTGTCWVLDTSLNTERMKNILKSVITRVILLFLLTNRFRNIFLVTHWRQVFLYFHLSFIIATKYFLAHPLYIMNSLIG